MCPTCGWKLLDLDSVIYNVLPLQLRVKQINASKFIYKIKKGRNP
jgi:hypothetical protein